VVSDRAGIVFATYLIEAKLPHADLGQGAVAMMKMFV
jgi:hypothetical protein